MVAAQCSSGEEDRKVMTPRQVPPRGVLHGSLQGLPGHPVGMPFPGRTDRGRYGRRRDSYCPMRVTPCDHPTVGSRKKSALRPFCPAAQTPESGYLRPPVNGSEYRKQESSSSTYRRHRRVPGCRDPGPIGPVPERVTHLQRIVGAIVGIILAMLGLLWSLQGAGLLRLCPVLCFADCECVTADRCSGRSQVRSRSRSG